MTQDTKTLLISSLLQARLILHNAAKEIATKDANKIAAATKGIAIATGAVVNLIEKYAKAANTTTYKVGADALLVELDKVFKATNTAKQIPLESYNNLLRFIVDVQNAVEKDDSGCNKALGDIAAIVANTQPNDFYQGSTTDLTKAEEPVKSTANTINEIEKAITDASERQKYLIKCNKESFERADVLDKVSAPVPKKFVNSAVALQDLIKKSVAKIKASNAFLKIKNNSVNENNNAFVAFLTNNADVKDKYVQALSFLTAAEEYIDKADQTKHKDKIVICDTFAENAEVIYDALREIEKLFLVSLDLIELYATDAKQNLDCSAGLDIEFENTDFNQAKQTVDKLKKNVEILSKADAIKKLSKAGKRSFLFRQESPEISYLHDITHARHTNTFAEVVCNNDFVDVGSQRASAASIDAATLNSIIFPMYAEDFKLFLKNIRGIAKIVDSEAGNKLLDSILKSDAEIDDIIVLAEKNPDIANALVRFAQITFARLGEETIAYCENYGVQNTYKDSSVYDALVLQQDLASYIIPLDKAIVAVDESKVVGLNKVLLDLPNREDNYFAYDIAKLLGKIALTPKGLLKDDAAATLVANFATQAKTIKVSNDKLQLYAVDVALGVKQKLKEQAAIVDSVENAFDSCIQKFINADDATKLKALLKDKDFIKTLEDFMAIGEANIKYGNIILHNSKDKKSTVDPKNKSDTAHKPLDDIVNNIANDNQDAVNKAIDFYNTVIGIHSIHKKLNTKEASVQLSLAGDIDDLIKKRDDINKSLQAKDLFVESKKDVINVIDTKLDEFISTHKEKVNGNDLTFDELKSSVKQEVEKIKTEDFANKIKDRISSLFANAVISDEDFVKLKDDKVAAIYRQKFTALVTENKIAPTRDSIRFINAKDKLNFIFSDIHTEDLKVCIMEIINKVTGKNLTQKSASLQKPADSAANKAPEDSKAADKAQKAPANDNDAAKKADISTVEQIKTVFSDGDLVKYLGAKKDDKWQPLGILLLVVCFVVPPAAEAIYKFMIDKMPKNEASNRAMKAFFPGLTKDPSELSTLEKIRNVLECSLFGVILFLPVFGVLYAIKKREIANEEKEVAKNPQQTVEQTTQQAADQAAAPAPAADASTLAPANTPANTPAPATTTENAAATPVAPNVPVKA